MAVKTEAFDGLTEIPAVSLPDFAGASGGSVLAYKFISSEPKSAPDWKLNVATETIESWVRAEIVNTIKQINDLQQSIASAVEEQSATTKDMASNIGEAARGGKEIASGIADVSKHVQETRAGAAESLKAAADLGRLSEQLKQAVARFRC